MDKANPARDSRGWRGGTRTIGGSALPVPVPAEEFPDQPDGGEGGQEKPPARRRRERREA